MLVPNPAVAPLTPLCVTVQLYVAPVTPLPVLNAMAVVWPLQIVCDPGAAITSGLGFTVTTTLIGVPAHPAPLTGVIVYVAVPGELVEVNTSAIGPDTGASNVPAAESPVTPPA